MVEFTFTSNKYNKKIKKGVDKFSKKQYNNTQLNKADDKESSSDEFSASRSMV